MDDEALNKDFGGPGPAFGFHHVNMADTSDRRIEHVGIAAQTPSPNKLTAPIRAKEDLAILLEAIRSAFPIPTKSGDHTEACRDRLPLQLFKG